MGRAGDGSTLTLDFTAMGGTIDSRITFSRADATPIATFINSSGFVQTVATAQAPRFDFDPITLVAKGLLLEGPATNLLNWSETFATTGGTNNNWADTNLTRTSTNNTSPRNDATALRITASAANGTIISSAAIGTSASRVLSVWLRRVTGTGNIQYTLDNGTSYTTQAITSSWVRYSFPATTAAQRVGFRIVTSADAIEIWGAQLETTASSSYIATGSGQVTRAADTAIIAGTNFTSWYTGGTSGTFVSNWYGSPLTATARTVIATSDQTTKHLHMYQTASALTLRLADFGAAATVTTANSLAPDVLTKGAFSYNGTATSLCLNGGTVATNTLAFSAAPTWLSIGGPSTNGTSITATDVMLNNSIRTLKYFPARLSDGQIQGLTDLSISTTADVLVVAGGGGGGGAGASSGGGGGGGGGGLIYTPQTLARSTTYAIDVGSGGAGAASTGSGSDGTATTVSILALSATGGGGGGGIPSQQAGRNGGCGGGASWGGSAATGGTGSQGFNGGSVTNFVSPFIGAGGGGAGAVGANGGAVCGTGGDGATYFGTTYAGGGGAGKLTGAGCAGGSGGGGAGGNPIGTAGTANTGGGGGAAGCNNPTGGGSGGAGGSGIVVFRYPGTPVASVTGATNTTTQSGGFTFHTFLVDGNLVTI